MAASLEVLLENRVIENFTDTGSLYQVRAGVVRRVGDIEPAIFVMLISADDSTADTFERVANLTDLSTISAARADAVAAGDDFYRVSNADIDFDDAEAASDGLIAVEDAINTLVREFNAFQGAGGSTTVQKVITGVDKTFLEQLKVELSTVQGEITTLEETEATLQTEIDNLKESLDGQQLRIQTLTTSRGALFSAVQTTYQSHLSQYTAILGFGALTSPEVVQVTGYQTAAQTDLANLPQTFGILDAIVSDERALLETTYQDLEEKTQEQAQAAAQLTEQRRLYDRTLSAIIELEPSFTAAGQ